MVHPAAGTAAWLSGAVLLLGSLAASAAEPIDDGNLKKLVEADWTAQEQRLGRSPNDPEAVRQVLERVQRLAEALEGESDPVDLHQQKVVLDKLARQVEQVDNLEEDQRLALYREIRWLGREIAMANPLVAGRPLVFLKQRRFVCQMLHEYLGYYYNYGGLSGGGVCVLEEPGRSLKTRELTADRLPRGAFTTLALSYDGKTAYFAFAEVRDVKRPNEGLSHWKKLPPAVDVPEEFNYFGPKRSSFHLFALDMESGDLRQLTEGREDDFDPCPMPDGHIVFISTRRGGFGRCHNPWEPLPVYTLHRMGASGDRIETLSWHETNEWHPSVLEDGRIVYSRWDYVDRSAAHFHGLWVTNPDGTNPAHLFGSYTQQINACYQPRAIPNSHRIAFIAGAHHAPVGGALVLLDPAKASLDPESGEDRMEAIERLTPEVVFPEAPDWPDCYYHSPWPLSEDYFLIAFSHGPLPGCGPGVLEETPTGLYYFDRFGNLELLYREEGISSMHPIPLAARPAPPAIPESPIPELADSGEGEFVLSNVHWGLRPLPEDRPVQQLRVYQVLPKTNTVAGNRPRIGYANAEPARMLLGTVPVEEDGSAYFRVPAGKLVYFQAVDGEGRAVQGMRSATYVRAGERRSCVGCHEPRPSTPQPRQLAAMKRPPSKIAPGPDGTLPMSYQRLVQPVLDRYCVSCHDGWEGSGKSAPELTSVAEDTFTRSYDQLKPFVRWYEWGGATIDPITGRPGRMGADESPLTSILEDQTHRERVRMSDADRRQLYLWLDSNAPFYGTYEADQQAAQQAGLAVDAPKVQ